MAIASHRPFKARACIRCRAQSSAETQQDGDEDAPSGQTDREHPRACSAGQQGGKDASENSNRQTDERLHDSVIVIFCIISKVD